MGACKYYIYVVYVRVLNVWSSYALGENSTSNVAARVAHVRCTVLSFNLGSRWGE